MNATFQMHVQRYMHFSTAGDIVITSENTEPVHRADDARELSAIALRNYSIACSELVRAAGADLQLR
jgi:hypothetical protein